jgi:hypothetical protein
LTTALRRRLASRLPVTADEALGQVDEREHDRVARGVGVVAKYCAAIPAINVAACASERVISARSRSRCS